MQFIELIKELNLSGSPADPGEPKAKEIYNGPRRRLIEIVLRDNAVLTKHKAPEPITVLCLAGNGVFRAGPELDEEIRLEAGTLITLEADVLHEALAMPELRLLVTRFKDL